jgi:hypothetical protein
MMFMLLLSFFKWWYESGWMGVIHALSTRLSNVSREFSLGQLLRTLFAPWKRIITYPGASLAERFQAGLDNLFSRSVGFVVRLFVIIGAIIAMFIVLLLSLIDIVLWPLLPLIIPGAIIVGVIK